MGLWLVVVTVFLCRYTLWALLMLVLVALHVYSLPQTNGEPPSVTSAGG